MPMLLLYVKNSDVLQKMRVVGIKCERYDFHLASIIMGYGADVE